MKNHALKSNERPKIGLALSGGAGRAVTHIGVLEALREHNIPVDYLAACSSGTIIAGSYACGTMEVLKSDWLKFDRKFVMNLFKISTSGRELFNPEEMIEFIKKYLLEKHFEEVNPRLGFTTVDVLTGESITLAMGDIAKAAIASSAVPALFPPVPWGNRLLVDGGLFSIVPTTQVKQMGADLVIGVDIAATRYAFSQKFYRLRMGYNFVRNSLPVRAYIAIHEGIDRLFNKSMNFIFYNQSDFFQEETIDQPGFLGILGRAVDISSERKRLENNVIADCDYLISPLVKHLGKFDFETTSQMIEEGRRATEAAIPDIKKLIEDYQWRLGHNDK